MLIKELPALAGDTTTIVWVGGDKTDGLLKSLLQGHDGVRRLPYDPDGTEATDTETLVAAFAGPDPQTHVTPDELGAALRRLPAGGRAVVLLGWPVEELPYHVLLDPLVDAGCQVLQAMPVERADQHGVHCAVIAARVTRLTPLRGYLDDSPITLTDDETDLRTLLRLAGEYTFGDLVSRPVRRLLDELRDQVDVQQKRIQQLEKDVRARDARLAAAQQRLTRLQSSTTFLLGRTIVQGARKPGRAILSVPVGLVRVWRNRGADRG